MGFFRFAFPAVLVCLPLLRCPADGSVAYTDDTWHGKVCNVFRDDVDSECTFVTLATTNGTAYAYTRSDFELLLIDDGSTDGSGVICDEYAQMDSRVRVFHKENGGVSSARNVGLDNAKGIHVMFVDSDDVVSNDFVGTLYSKTYENKCLLGVCKFQKFHQEIEIYKRNITSRVVKKEEYLGHMFDSSFMTACNKIYHKTLCSLLLNFPCLYLLKNHLLLF